MDYDEVMDYLDSRGQFNVKFGLDATLDIMKALGNPHKDFKSIHIAGTNGKGSVSSFISRILIEQGYKVGVYTSPHLVDFSERIRVNEKNISKKDIVRIVEKIKPNVSEQTYFEIVTALAFEYFSEQKVDFAVVEVGMGGRLDATNIVIPEVSVITNISLEHTEYLGETISKITEEKAGIIKQGVPVVTSRDGEAFEIIKKICKDRGSELNVAEENGVEISMKGDFQKKNAMLALGVVEVLKQRGIKVSKDAVQIGLKTAKWPGRMDLVQEKMMFDCAHNPEGAKTLVEELISMGHRDVVMVIGIMKDKDISKMVSEFEKISNEIILCRPDIERAASALEIAKHLNKKSVMMPSVKKALKYAEEIADDRLIVLTGSIFTVGEGFQALGIELFDN